MSPLAEQECIGRPEFLKWGLHTCGIKGNKCLTKFRIRQYWECSECEDLNLRSKRLVWANDGFPENKQFSMYKTEAITRTGQLTVIFKRIWIYHEKNAALQHGSHHVQSYLKCAYHIPIQSSELVLNCGQTTLQFRIFKQWYFRLEKVQPFVLRIYTCTR